MTSHGPFHLSCAPESSEHEEQPMQLQFSGSLVVSDKGGGIAYSFPGPDRRYNRSRFFIRYEDLLKTAEAIRVNWAEFERMRNTVGLAVNVEKTGVLGMTIRAALIEPGIKVFDVTLWSQAPNRRRDMWMN